jgi:hypothetical protein
MSGVIHVSNALITMKTQAGLLRISKFIPDHMHILGSLAESGRALMSTCMLGGEQAWIEGSFVFVRSTSFIKPGVR